MQNSVPPVPPAWTRRRLWRNAVALGGLFVALVLLLAGLWIQHAADQALKEQIAQGLEAVTATTAAALEFWIENELRAVRDWSELPDVRTAAQALAAVAVDRQGPRGDLLSAPESTELLAALKPLSESDDYDGFGLVSRDGLVLAASIPEQVGRTLTQEGAALLAGVLRGEGVLTRPYQRGQMLSGAPGFLDAPFMLALAPVRDERDEAIAAFYLIIRTEKDSHASWIARQSEAGDTYAFDRDGLMLSDSRHEQQLKTIGLIPNELSARSILRIQLRILAAT